MKKKRFKCDRCDYTTNVKFNFQTHALKHSKKNSKKKFSCVECKFKTDYVSSYNESGTLGPQKLRTPGTLGPENTRLPGTLGPETHWDPRPTRTRDPLGPETH